MPDREKVNPIKQVLKEPGQINQISQEAISPLEQRIDYNFRNGLNADASVEHLGKNELRIADNVNLAKRGSVAKKGGTSLLLSRTNKITQIITWPLNPNKIFFIENSTLYLYNTSSDTEIISQNILGDKMGCFFYKKMYFLDGREYYECDGENIKIVRPYLYLTSVTGDFEIGETITGGGTGATATVDIIDGDNLGVSKITGTFAEDEAVHGNHSGAAGVIDTMDNGVSEDNNLSVIKNCEMAKRHSKSFRIFFSGNNKDSSAIYYSEKGNPKYVKKTSVVYPTTGEGEVITLRTFMDSVMVIYKHNLWSWRGIDPTSDAIWEELPTSQGALSRYGTSLTTNSLTMYGPGGIYALSPNIIGVPMSMQPGENYIYNLAQDKVVSELKRISNPAGTVSVFDSTNERYLLAYSDNVSGENNKVLVYDWYLKGFTRYTDININDFCYRPDGELWAASENKIIRMNDGQFDGKYKILTNRYKLNAPFRDKHIKQLLLALENPQIEGYTVKVTVIVDDVAVEEETIEIEPGPSNFIAKIPVREIGSRIELMIEG